jgi:hypothetical protein
VAGDQGVAVPAEEIAELPGLVIVVDLELVTG